MTGLTREANFEDVVSFAKDLIRIPGLSGDEGEVAGRVRREMEALGFEEVRVDDVGNVIGVIRGSGAAPPVLLNCHLDVVAEGKHEEWEHPPFGGVVAGGFLHGRGAMDIKGPLAIQTHAAAELRGRALGDIIVAHTVFEERGGLGMKHLLESGSVAPGAVIIGESTHGDLCIGHRGRGEVEVIIHGLAGHASAPHRARNALLAIPHVLEAVHRLAEDDTTDAVLGCSSIVASMIEVLPESRNVIPDQAVVTLDWRVLPGTDTASMLSLVEKALDQGAALPEGLSIEVRMAKEFQKTYTGHVSERDLFSPGFLMDPNDPLVTAAAVAVGVQTGEAPAAVRPWAFATDGGWSRGVHGIPTVGFAPGEERYAHTNTERLDLDEARWAYGRYPALIGALHQALSD
jgi:succinyl-diaminopimelate desuccinylase